MMTCHSGGAGDLHMWQSMVAVHMLHKPRQKLSPELNMQRLLTIMQLEPYRDSVIQLGNDSKT